MKKAASISARSRRRFRGDKDRDYLGAVNAVHALAEAESLDSAQRAVAEAICDEMEAQWMRRGDLRRTSGVTCINRLIAGKCTQYRGGACVHHPPLHDHADLYMRDGEPAAYVSHEYGIKTEDLRRAVQFADQYGLDVAIYADSWHFPMATVRVVYTKQEER